MHNRVKNLGTTKRKIRERGRWKEEEEEDESEMDETAEIEKGSKPTESGLNLGRKRKRIVAAEATDTLEPIEMIRTGPSKGSTNVTSLVSFRRGKPLLKDVLNMSR